MIDAVFPVLLEAALRALAAAVLVWSALCLLRVRNVRAQKTAWTLMLAGALAMPLLMRWQWLPSADAIQVPPLSRVFAPALSSLRAAVLPVAPAPPADEFIAAEAAPVPPPFAWSAASQTPFSAFANQPEAAERATIDLRDSLTSAPIHREPRPITLHLPAHRPAAAEPSSSRLPRLLDLAWMLYLLVAALLLLRLVGGLASALRLWIVASPVLVPTDLAERIADLAPAGHVRWSRRVNSPANIGSGVLLPADYCRWSDEKLRAVLAHECAHVRQGDFYLQLLAGFYAALTWFSPLGWWLKRKLSELGEAMGDRAGLEEAASPSSYAQMLLEFAALPRPTRTGVAMARTGHLAPRIERLLNPTTFQDAFARGGRRRAALALIVVFSVLATSAALVRVQAAGQSSSAAPPASQAQPSAAAPESGISSPPAQTISDQDQQPPAPAAVPEPPSPAATPNPAPAPSPAPGAQVPSPAAAPDAAMPAPPAPGQVAPPPVHIQVPPIPPIDVHIPPMPNINGKINKALAADMKAMQSGVLAGQVIREANGGEPWALVPAQGEPIMNAPGPAFFFTGDSHAVFHGPDHAEIDQARKTAHAPFFWFKHDGKSYVVEDPAVVAQVESLEKPIQDLRTRMRDLRKQQREAGEQLRQKMRAQRQAPIPKPDLSKQMADLNAAVDTLKSSQGDTITRDQLMKLQAQIAQLQAQVFRAESGLYNQNGQWGAEMGAFGKQMGQLGAEEGRLAGEMARMTRANRDKIDSIIQQTLSDGKAKPVNDSGSTVPVPRGH